MELENSMLRPCVHDERYDEPYWEVEEEESERKFDKGDVVTDGKERYVITSIVYEDINKGWIYECEPLGDSEYAFVELAENELSA